MQTQEMLNIEVVDCGEMTIGCPLDNIAVDKIYIAAKSVPKANAQWAYLYIDKNGNTIASKYDTLHGNIRVAEITAAIEALELVRDDRECVVVIGSSPLLLRVLDGRCTGGRYKELYDKFRESAQRPNILVSCLQGMRDEYHRRCEELLEDNNEGGKTDA